MAEPLQTYTALYTEIVRFLDTSNTLITNRIPTFVYTVEQELNRRFIPPAAWSRRYHTINSGSANARFVTLPPETIRVTRVHIDESPYEPLEQETASALMNLYPRFDSGKPKAFAIIGEVLEFSHTPDADYTVEIVSRQRIWPLNKDVSDVSVADYQSHIVAADGLVVSNYWTVHASDILLFGALKHGFQFMNDTRKAQEAQQNMAMAMNQFDKYTTSKAFTENHGVSVPDGVMVV